MTPDDDTREHAPTSPDDDASAPDGRDGDAQGPGDDEAAARPDQDAAEGEMPDATGDGAVPGASADEAEGLDGEDSRVPDSQGPGLDGELEEMDDAWAMDQSSVDTGEFYLGLGSEAYVPQHDFAEPVDSHFPDPRSIAREVRVIEQRMRERISPAFPREVRRRLPMEWIWSRFRQVAMRGRSDMVDDLGRDPLYSARYAPILEFLYKRYFRVDVIGASNVPSKGRAILVANHSGLLPYDGLLLMHALRRTHPARREARPLIEDFVFHFPYVGTLVNRIGGVRACPENAEHLLEREHVIAVFPEGIKGISKLYKHRYQLQRFGRGGFVRLALRTGSPIIPVAIVGAEETNPVMGKVTWLSKITGVPFLPFSPTFLVPLPVKWYMRIGEPIDIQGAHGTEAASDRVLVNRLTDEVRSTIQEMVDDTLAKRRSVFLG